MSDIIWCDVGGHPFSAADPERDFWTKPGNEYGQNQLQPRMDVCGEHKNFTVKMPNYTAPSASAIQGKMRNKQAQEAKEKGYDPDYVKWLEDQADKPIPGVDEE